MMKVQFDIYDIELNKLNIFIEEVNKIYWKGNKVSK